MLLRPGAGKVHNRPARRRRDGQSRSRKGPRRIGLARRL